MARENHHSIYGQKRTEVSAYIIAGTTQLFTIVLAWKLGVLTPRGNAMCLRAFFNNITRVVI